MITNKKVKLGHKLEKAVDSPRKSEMIYPTVYIENESELGLSLKDVGKVLTAKVDLKFVGVRQRTEANKKTMYSYDFEIRTVQFGD